MTIPDRITNGNGSGGRPGDGPLAPPQNLEAEQSVLGAVLLSDTALPALIIDERLQPTDFYREAHGIVFEAMLALHTAGEPVDALTLVEHLKQTGRLEAAGGRATIDLLAASVPAVGHLRQYARIVRENAMLRRLLRASYEIQARVHAHDAPPRELVDIAERVILEVAHEDSRKDFRGIHDVLDVELSKLEALSREGKEITGTPSGFGDVDSITGGFQPGNLIVLAARPSMGKCLAGSALVLDARSGARRRIDELVRAHEAGEELAVLALDAQQGLRPARVSHALRSGVQHVFRVTTRLGRQLDATANHPLLTPAGWRELRALAPGGRIAVARALPAPPRVAALPDHEVVLLAALVAGGEPSGPAPQPALGAGSVLAPLVARATAALGGPDALAALCARHGLSGVAAADRRVPAAIFGLGAEQVARFLGVLFACAGHVHVSARLRQISFSAPGARLALDVQHLLLRVGVVARRRRVAAEHELLVGDSAALAAFVGAVDIPGKQHRLARIGAHLAAHHFPAAGEEPAAGRDDGDVLWDEIAAIEPLGEQETYDLTVPGPHNFLADDVVVHNSALMANFAENAALGGSGKAVALFSLEMSESELAQRFIASQASIKGDDLRKGRVPASRWAKIMEASNRLAQSPLYIDDSSDLSVLDVRAKARRLMQQHPDGLGLVLIDYLQLMRGDGRTDNRVEQIGQISRGLKTLARELECPVIALSQLNRGVEQRTDKRPVLSDLRESGAIEQDADLVMFIYRDEYYDRESEREGIADLIISKHRNGGLGNVELTFQKEYPRFMSYVGDDGY